MKFLGGNTVFEERINRLQFPVTDQSKWTDTRTELVHSELTIEGFGLSQAPSYIEIAYTETHEAVGYGTLIIPTENGTASEPIEALLLKVSLSNVSHYYLGGALAPETLTNALGVTQGEEVVSSHYIFYTPGFHINVMRINLNEEGETTSAFYRPSAAATTEPINISHTRVCDVPSEGQSQVTVTVTGGAAPYQVSGNFNGEVEENESFIFILDDNETGYDIIVVDADGNESQVFETGLIPCTKLPVELLAFEGEVQKEGNLLQWTTASELNNQHFMLNYSTDGQNFLPLQKMAGNGTTSAANRYDFMHRNAAQGTTYYRLSQTDFDGTTKDLGTISLKRGETTAISSIEVYPTATSHQLNISYSFAGQANTTILKVYDMTGRVVKSQDLGDNSLQFQLNVADLNPGTYLLQIESGAEVLSSRFVKF
ncbi:MAG: T9SS type A sorting domain-containing protein [Chitinophagales bacterium]